MKKKVILGIGAALLVLAAVIAVYLIVQEAQPVENKQIVLIPKAKDEANEFWSALIAGAHMAADEKYVELTVKAPEREMDVDIQNSMILEAVEAKPDVIIIAPSSYQSSTAYIKKAIQAGIQVVLVDSEIDEDIIEAKVATDNFEMGKKLGEYMQLFIAEEPHIAVVSHVAQASTAIEREAGVRDGLGDYEKNIEQVVFSDSGYQSAYDLTIELLTEHPEINMITGMNEYSSLGMARAVKYLGRQNQVAVFGVDSSVAQVQLLEEGIYKAIVVQNPFNMGYLSVVQAVECIDGKKGKYTDSQSALVTKTDMYSKENQKILFPFIGQQAKESYGSED
ncbi:MAG: substrate-binding domain-containing protein [Lachnospiraceae bacterium]